MKQTLFLRDFTEKHTKAQRGEVTAQGHMARKQQSNNLNTSLMGLTQRDDITRKPLVGECVVRRNPLKSSLALGKGQRPQENLKFIS